MSGFFGSGVGSEGRTDVSGFATARSGRRLGWRLRLRCCGFALGRGGGCLAGRLGRCVWQATVRVCLLCRIPRGSWRRCCLLLLGRRCSVGWPRGLGSGGCVPGLQGRGCGCFGSGREWVFGERVDRRVLGVFRGSGSAGLFVIGLRLRCRGPCTESRLVNGVVRPKVTSREIESFRQRCGVVSFDSSINTASTTDLSPVISVK